MQVDNDHQLFMNNQEDMKEIKEMLGEINLKVSHINDVKMDRPFADSHPLRTEEGGR